MIRKFIIALMLTVVTFAVCAQVPDDVVNSVPYEQVKTGDLGDLSVGTITRSILSGDWKWDIGDIFNKGITVIFSSLRSNLAIVVLIIVVSLLSSVLLSLKTTLSSEVSEVGFYAAYVIVACLGVKGVDIAISYGLEITRQLDVYIKTLLPVMMAVYASSGCVVSAGVIQPLVVGISQFIAFAVTNWLIPGLTLTCGLCVVNSMSSKADLTGIINFMQKSMRWCAGILMTAFIGIMTIQCMISPALDSVSGKVTKYAIANFVPVVGGLISESIGIVAGYSSTLCGAVGGAGVICGVVMCVKPLAEIGGIGILYNLSSAILRPVCDKRFYEFMSALGQIVTTLFILTVMMLLMFIINICCVVNISGFTGVIR